MVYTYTSYIYIYIWTCRRVKTTLVDWGIETTKRGFYKLNRIFKEQQKVRSKHISFQVSMDRNSSAKMVPKMENDGELSKTKRSIYYLSAHPIYPSRMANKNANFQRPKLPKTSSLNFRLLRLRPLS